MDKGLIAKAYRYISHDLWQTDLDTHKQDSFLTKYLKLSIMSVRGFIFDGCALRASALTYYSLLAIVPVLALAFGIATGFGLEKIVEKAILANFENYKNVAGEAIDFAKNLLQETKGSVIAGAGVLVLIWTIIRVLGQIETTFNTIWFVRKGRSWKRKFSDYLSISWVFPFLLIISNATTVMMLTQIELFTKKIPVIGEYSHLIRTLSDLMPVFITWAILTFLYMFLPNTRVKFRSALFSGFVATIIYFLFHSIYVYFQIGIASYGAVYGSFAAFPLFLLWVQISWMIVLFGAEVTYAHQNLGITGLKRAELKMSLQDRRTLQLRTMQLLVKRFESGKDPLTSKELSEKIGLPLQIMQLIIDELVDTHLLSPTAINGERAYQPALDISHLKVYDVIHLIDQAGTIDLPMSTSKDLTRVKNTLEKLEESVKKSSANKLIKEI